jgi:hypothetical protein
MDGRLVVAPPVFPVLAVIGVQVGVGVHRRAERVVPVPGPAGRGFRGIGLFWGVEPFRGVALVRGVGPFWDVSLIWDVGLF